MKKNLQFLILSFLCLSVSYNSNAQSVPVTKTNPVKVYVHYMPWFTAPENPGPGATSFGNGNTGTFNKWGNHWTNEGSNTKHPDNFITVTDNTGASVQVRDIVAHFHPLIGPYDGQDTAVLEYHLLLMKLSGIDGVMIDWYGVGGEGVGDAAPLLVNSNALIANTRTAGLKYGLIMEDAGWKGMSGADSNGTYAIKNYFSDSQFIKLGDLRGASAANASAPVLGVFGPQQFRTPGQWNTILGGNTQAFLPLFNQSAQIGVDAGGEFAWPDPQADLTGNANGWYNNIFSYYSSTAENKNVVLGTAFPGFDDFYGTNGADKDGIIARTFGSTTTLSTTLGLDNTYKSELDGIQIATWNDFSEGTIIEPTVEEGFQSLDTIQRFTGVPYTEADLKQVYRFFTLRKKYVGDGIRQSVLNRVFNFFTSLQLPQAVTLMDSLDNVTAITPIVSISSAGAPSENGATGEFIITGTGITSNITVKYITGGTATSAHYTSNPALSGSVVLTAASPSDTITIAAVDDTIVNPNETIQLTLVDDTAYIIQKQSDSLIILDNETPPCSGPMVVNTTNVPVIDGAIDSVWAKAPANLIGQTISGIIQTGSTWQAMYDTANLYLLIQVKDSNLSNKGANIYDQDGVEVFIAGNNSKAGAYTNNDHQYRFNWNIFPYSTENITGATGSTAGITYAIPTTKGGYTLEISIPWTTIGGTAPFNGKLIGFDIDINDQQNNTGQREATVGWSGTNSDDYQNTAGFGTAALTICTSTTTPAAPIISSIDNIDAKQGKAFTFAILASSSPINYSAVNLPAGLAIDTTTGIITGTPTTPGSFSVPITATNSLGTASDTLIITVDPIPVITSVDSVYGKEGRIFNYTIVASNNPVSYGVSGLPAGLTIDTTTGIISGTPIMYGNFNTTINATNNIGTDNKTLVIVIDSTPAVLYSSINAVRQTNAFVAIQWIVDSELSVKQYEVQQSTDSINFTTISTIADVGNNDIDSVIYNIIDVNASAGAIYYRIKATGLYDNAGIYYSAVIKVDRIAATTVYPNPVTTGNINIPFNNPVAEKYTVTLINSLGQSMYSATINVGAGSIIYPLQLNKKFAAGPYQLELINENGGRTVYTILIE